MSSVLDRTEEVVLGTRYRIVPPEDPRTFNELIPLGFNLQATPKYSPLKALRRLPNFVRMTMPHTEAVLITLRTLNGGNQEHNLFLRIVIPE